MIVINCPEINWTSSTKNSPQLGPEIYLREARKGSHKVCLVHRTWKLPLFILTPTLFHIGNQAKTYS